MNFPFRLAILRVFRTVFATALVLGSAQAEASAPTTIKALRSLHLKPNQPLIVEGTVTAFSGWNTSFFLQDETGAISVNRLENTAVHTGDRVMVRGTLNPGYFAPVIVSAAVTVLAGGTSLPRPKMPAYDELATGRFDSSRVAVRGVVHSARIETVWDRKILLLGLSVHGEAISVHILDYAGLNVDSLVDSTVRIAGVCGTKFNDRRQIIGLRLFVPDASGVDIESPAPDPASIRNSDMSQVLQYSLANEALHRVKMTGILTYQSQEHGLYLQQNGAAIHLQPSQRGPFTVGERLEALGFLHTFGYSAGLQDAVVRPLGKADVPSPLAVAPSAIIAIKDGFRATSYDGLLVRVRAGVVERIASSRNQVWLLRAGNVLFQAELAGVGSSDNDSFEAKSTVDITGVCVVEVDDNGFPASFRLLLRSPADITVATSPYSKRAGQMLLAGLLLLLLGGFALWRFGQIRNPQSEKVSRAASLQELLSKFELASRIQTLLVFSLALVSFAFFPHPAQTQIEFVGSVFARLALAVAALAVWWNRETGWKGNCSICFAMLSALVPFSPWAPGAASQVAIQYSFCATGLATLLLRSRRLHSVAQLLFVAVGAVSILNSVARLYGASPSYGVARHTAMPPVLSGCLFLLSGAALCSRPASGLMRTISSPGFGGLVLRRLLPATFAIPVLIGWIRLQCQVLGWFDTLWGIALVATANILSFDGIMWASATILNRQDLARSEVEEALRERDTRLELLFDKTGIGDYTWDIRADSVRYHPAIRGLYGAEELPESITAEWFRERQHPADADLIALAVRNAIENRTPLDVEFRVVLPDGGIRWLSCRGNVLYDSAGQATHINGLNMDVTARKRSEAAVRKGMESVREADRQLRTALEFAKTPVWRWITSTNAINWTGPVEAIFGKTAHQLSHYRQVLDMVHPDDLAHLESSLGQALASGCEFDAEFRIIVDGATRWLAGRGDVLRDDSGQIYGMSGVNFDITATKMTAERLIDSERSFRELADAMPQIVWTSNAANEAQYLNKQWYAYTASSTIEERRRFIHPEDAERIAVAMEAALRTASPFEFEIRLLRARDQSYRWHLTRGLPLLGDGGAVARWYGTSTDIEDLKLARMQVESLNADLERRVEERSTELAESELRYRLLVEGVKDYAILLLDSSGCVKSWNQGAALLTGYKARDILGQHFSTFYNEAAIRSGEPEQSLKQAMAEERSHHEGWRRRQDGTEFWASAVITSLWDSNRQLCGFSKVIRDMTEQRRAESLLSKRAESATEAKTAFLASVSHEIRTPMNAILGMAEMLWESELSPAQRHYVGIFRRAGANLLTLINDILDLSKIESGNFSLEESTFNISELIDQVLEILRPKAESKSISLRAQFSCPSAPPVLGDPVRLQQVLLNLLGNAIKFTDKGRVLLRVDCSWTETHATLHFDVCDTGIGIPADKLETIFEDFEQAETSTTRRFGGTGLGLGISRRLVRRMRGEIKAHSELGQGSTFSFHVTLPVGAEKDTADLAQPQDMRDKEVLIVDNDSTNRLILSEMCGAWGMAVSSCASGDDALRLTQASLHNRPFALALVDRNMPGMDGFEVAAGIRTASPQTAIFIVSSDNRDADVSRCREMGLAGHLTKPVRRKELMRRIVKVVGRNSVPGAVNPLISLGPAPVDPKRKFRVLVAEDSEDNRFLLQVYCEGTPYGLTFVEDGEQAVTAFQSASPDLIVMDVQMPVMDGLAATREIRALESAVNTPRTPILALTANALPGDVKRAHDAGCDAHLSKPISKKDFLGGLGHWLRQLAP